VWTTCPESLHGSGMAGIWTRREIVIESHKQHSWQRAQSSLQLLSIVNMYYEARTVTRLKKSTDCDCRLQLALNCLYMFFVIPLLLLDLLLLLLAATVVWNALPVLYLRSTSTSRGQFRAGLKTHHFNQAYNILWEHFVLRVYFTYFFLTYSLTYLLTTTIDLQSFFVTRSIEARSAD